MRPRTAAAVPDGDPVAALRSGSRLSRQARLGRALLVAVLSTLIALASHVLAGGSVPGLPGVLVPLALSVFVCLPLSGRVLSMSRLVPSVLVSQLLFHWLFVLGASGPDPLLVDDAPAHHTGHSTPTATMLRVGTETASPADHSDAWMWVGHGVAAVITILLIQLGEAALIGLWRLAASLVRALLPRLPRPEGIPAALPHRVRGFLNRRRLLHRTLGAAISRRGPPRSTLPALS